MELHNRPPVQRERVFLKIALLVLVLMMAGSRLWESVDTCLRFPQAKRNAVSVSAVISNVDRDTDTDGDYEYDVYIRYDYAGKSYDVCCLSGSSDSTWNRRVNQTMSVLINPDRPEELISRMEISVRNTPFGFGVFNMWLCVLAIPSRKKWTETYGNGRRFVQQDLKDCVRRRCLWKWSLLTGAEMMLAGLFLREVIPVWTAPVGAVLIGFGLFRAKRYMDDLQKINNDEFTICPCTVTNKYDRLNRDYLSVYFLEYSDGERSWRRNVTSEVYEASRIGQVQEGVYLPGKELPMMMLTQSGAEDV